MKELVTKFNSKKELYTFLERECGAYLPNKDATNIYFLTDILKGKKKVSASGAITIG